MVRIRKNSKLSPLLFCSQHSALDDDLQPRLCKLNQSPWDVYVTFHSLLDSSHQFEAEDGLYVNGNLGHAIVAEESVASPMDIDGKPDTAAVHGSMSTDGNVFRWCQRNNGKSWQCHKEAKEDLNLCEYHLKLESRRNVNYCIYTNENNSNIISNSTAKSLSSKKAVVTANGLLGTRRPKVVAKKGEAALKNPYEFYYYSGFSPRWGRKRGTSKHKMEAKVASAENVGTTPTTSCTTQISNPESPSSHKIDKGDQLEYIEDDFDDDEDEDGGGECGRKRMRRHVKARSLKSLM